jgi:hypothetical protein
MATTAIHKLTLDPMGKCSYAFFGSLVSIFQEVSEKKHFETFFP